MVIIFWSPNITDIRKERRIKNGKRLLQRKEERTKKIETTSTDSVQCQLAQVQKNIIIKEMIHKIYKSTLSPQVYSELCSLRNECKNNNNLFHKQLLDNYVQICSASSNMLWNNIRNLKKQTSHDMTVFNMTEMNKSKPLTFSKTTQWEFPFIFPL